MRIASVLLIVAGLTAGLIGCDGSGSLQSDSGTTSETPSEIKPSPEARYTLLLKTFSQSNHVEQASRYKLNTEKLAGWDGLYIEIDDDHSALYWGKYATIEDTKKNLKRAHEYTTPFGVTVYLAAVAIPIEKDVQAPPQWDLRIAPGVYTVLVAEFYDVPDRDYYGRKQFAVEYCRQLRGQGKRAFYHHGLAKSQVTVGAFGATAAKLAAPSSFDMSRKETTLKMTKGDAPTQPAAPSVLVPLDARMKQIIDEFEYLAVNGRTENRRAFDPLTRKYIMIPARPEPIAIPRSARR